MEPDVRLIILLLLITSAPVDALAQRPEPLSESRVRALAREAEAKARGDKTEIVLTLDDRFRQRVAHPQVLHQRPAIGHERLGEHDAEIFALDDRDRERLEIAEPLAEAVVQRQDDLGLVATRLGFRLAGKRTHAIGGNRLDALGGHVNQRQQNDDDRPHSAIIGGAPAAMPTREKADRHAPSRMRRHDSMSNVTLPIVSCV